MDQDKSGMQTHRTECEIEATSCSYLRVSVPDAEHVALQRQRLGLLSADVWWAQSASVI